MIPIFWAVLLYMPFLCASLPNTRGLNGATIPTLDVSDSPSNSDTRTVWDIWWSCTATLFACTWTAIHPNVPGIDEGKITIASRRLFIMAMALIFPELIITWATLQFFSARKAARNFNDAFGEQLSQAHHEDRCIESATALLDEIQERNSPSPRTPRTLGHELKGWTVTHGFFAWTGGFLLYVDDEPRATLTPDELLRFVRDGSVDVPVIAEADIDDRSKGDGLSKGVAIIQLVWFVLQLVARSLQNLPTTLLELDTLAVAALTCIAYGWWWKKPKDVGRSYSVHWKASAPPPSNLAYDNERTSYYGRNFVFLSKFLSPVFSLSGLETTISTRAALSRRVPSLGGYDEQHGPDDVYPLSIGCLGGMVFAGLHCIGWNFSFPTHTENILWRTASLTMGCAGAVNLLFAVHTFWWRRSSFAINEPFLLVGSIGAYIYIAARVTLMVLMLSSLRSLPPGVYDTVSWTKFIPHV